jgi:hypothetical protein
MQVRLKKLLDEHEKKFQTSQTQLSALPTVNVASAQKTYTTSSVSSAPSGSTFVAVNSPAPKASVKDRK